MRSTFNILWRLGAVLLGGCAATPESDGVEPADLLLIDGRVYTLSWSEPGLDGTPASDAPHDERGWHPDADTVAVRDGRIVFVGRERDAGGLRGQQTRVIDLDGATVLPGFVDSHTHASSYGEVLARVNLVGVETEEEAVERIVRAAASVPKGEWIEAWGFDEGQWADRMPTKALLTRRVPEHPVHAVGLHGFATWNNELSLLRAGITGSSVSPPGGEIVLGFCSTTPATCTRA